MTSQTTAAGARTAKAKAARTAFPWHSIRHANGSVRDRYEVYRTDTNDVVDEFPYNSELARGVAYVQAQALMVELNAVFAKTGGA
jgi:hypothetical protein